MLVKQSSSFVANPAGDRKAKTGENEPVFTGMPGKRDLAVK